MTAEQRAASFSWKFCPGGEGHDEGADKAMDCHKCHVECLQAAGDEALRRFVDEVAPEHGRTSCSDEDSNGNEFFNEFGSPRCTRCALLYRVAHGAWMYGATFRVDGLSTEDGNALREATRMARKSTGGTR